MKDLLEYYEELEREEDKLSLVDMVSILKEFVDERGVEVPESVLTTEEAWAAYHRGFLWEFLEDLVETGEIPDGLVPGDATEPRIFEEIEVNLRAPDTTLIEVKHRE